jgi:hypothetical protein
MLIKKTDITTFWVEFVGRLGWNLMRYHWFCGVFGQRASICIPHKNLTLIYPQIVHIILPNRVDFGDAKSVPVSFHVPAGAPDEIS